MLRSDDDHHASSDRGGTATARVDGDVTHDRDRDHDTNPNDDDEYDHSRAARLPGGDGGRCGGSRADGRGGYAC